MREFSLLLWFCISISALNSQPLPPNDLNNPESTSPLEFTMDKVYLQTDRSIYSGGEIIFFKVFLNDDKNQARESGVVYIDLIGPSSNIISQRTIKISNGSGNGDISLSSIAKNGQYLVRAYTSYMRNFSEEYFFRKHIYISNYGIENIVQMDSPKDQENQEIFLDFSSEKTEYQKEDEINIALDLYNEDGNAIPSDLLVSVYQSSYARNGFDQQNISAHFNKSQKSNEMKKNNLAFTYPNENSLTLSGTVTKKDQEDAPVKAQGLITSLDNDFFTKSFGTDRQGKFTVDSIEVYGNTTLIIQAAKGKKKIEKSGKIQVKGNKYVSIKLDERLRPAISSLDSTWLHQPMKFNYNHDHQNSVFLSTNAVSDWDDEGLIGEFDELTITAPKIEEVIEHYEKGMLYKRPDQRIVTEKIDNLHQYNDIYSILAGEVSGMELTRPELEGAKKAIIFRGYKTGFSRQVRMGNGAVFMLNGAFASHNLIESIPPQNIAFIDVLKGLSKLNVYGELGSNGIIMVYLKPPVMRQKMKKKSFGTFNVNFEGYHIAQSFQELVQESGIAPRKTIYWNPDVSIDNSGEYEFSFMAPNKVGTYEVLVEGLSKDGDPVYGTYQFSVK